MEEPQRGTAPPRPQPKAAGRPTAAPRTGGRPGWQAAPPSLPARHPPVRPREGHSPDGAALPALGHHMGGREEAEAERGRRAGTGGPHAWARARTHAGARRGGAGGRWPRPVRVTGALRPAPPRLALGGLRGGWWRSSGLAPGRQRPPAAGARRAAGRGRGWGRIPALPGSGAAVVGNGGRRLQSGGGCGGTGAFAESRRGGGGGEQVGACSSPRPLLSEAVRRLLGPRGAAPAGACPPSLLRGGRSRRG